ncbi:hypothetical protein GCM10010169_22770 [Micromonospora fulviviridis]|nr:hypothetical protein GCM10010169_22770 [Micromonospora fulviviridis]
MGSGGHFAYTVGQRVDSEWRGRKVHFTPLMQEALPIMRGALIVVALRQETITYKALSIAIDQRYHYRQLGDPLDVLSQDCFLHNEPSLAALVTRGDTSQPGEAFIGDATAEQEACYKYWADRRRS